MSTQHGTPAGRITRISLLYVVLVALGALFSAPVVWMLSSSLHRLADVFAQPYQWIPEIWQWDNYVRAVTILPVGRFLFNTIAITVPVMIATVLSSALVAYGFARFRFPGRDWLFSLCLGTMMLPGQVTMIPLYMLFAKLGWVDTYLPLIVPALFGSPFYIFLLRQFFLTIPRDSEEAALIDGASPLRIWWSVILPQARPALATVLIFTFIGTWNDFFGPLLYLNSPEKATLTLGLNLMKTQVLGSGVVEWNVLMAASLLVLLPNVILFFFAQRHFISGISMGAGK
ncbi:MAG: carbohydrate ABC transporter permease [Opitutaceae bacterium]|nr:carbohydrate ABC transporter permease [Cephaloticoccus sp.]MCP5531385.1 carbohydrate ABC transporter permease [Opitutaceae bacterium]